MEQDRVAAAANSKAAAIAQAQKNKNKKFINNQDARRFHNARHHPDAIGWLCNWAGCVHLYSEGGPDDCHDPAKGGCDYFGRIRKNEHGWYVPD